MKWFMLFLFLVNLISFLVSGLPFSATLFGCGLFGGVAITMFVVELGLAK